MARLWETAEDEAGVNAELHGEAVDLAEGGGVVEQGVEGVGGDGGARASQAHGTRARAVLIEAGGGGEGGREDAGGEREDEEGGAGHGER